MKVLVIGGGGREHALVWKLARSKKVKELFVAPGNAGTEQIATNVPLECTQIDELLEFAASNAIDLTIVGMDNSLELGVVDVFEAKDLKIFGPSKFAAQIETSKAFSKEMMKKLNIPTAEFEIFKDHTQALEYALKQLPVVIKADGLARGKGVYICKSQGDCQTAINEIMVDKSYGNSGNKVVVEEYLDGYEISLHAFCDGKTFKLFPVTQDNKTIFDGDKGSNTGGMGAVGPANVLAQKEVEKIAKQIIQPVLDEFVRLGYPFVGILYPGLRITSKGMRVLEYNARFGDPECQVYMRLLETNLVDILESCIDGVLENQQIEWSKEYAACIVIASGGYPESSEKGVEIFGLEETAKEPKVEIFHAGTKKVEGKVVTNGGRVLNITTTNLDLREAIKQAYKAVNLIDFARMQYRTDIGKKLLK